MADVSVPESSPAPDSAAGAALAEPPKDKPAPTPNTPEKVTAWNRYIDRYLVVFALMLVFLAAVRPITSQSIWGLLRAGERISHGAPITTDTLSYTRAGERWINVPWVFEVANYQVFDAARRAFSSETDASRGDRNGASAITLLNALIGVATATLLLFVRRRGPGLWWSVLCVTVALGGFVIPANASSLAVAIGGFAVTKPTVDPRTWGLFFLALQIFLLHSGVNLGRGRALWILPFVFALWANVDESFVVGVMLQAAWTLGYVIQHVITPRDRKAAGAPGVVPVVGVLLVGALATLANPSTYHAWLLSIENYQSALVRMFGGDAGLLTRDRIGFFGQRSSEVLDAIGGAGTARTQVAFYLLTVWVGLIFFAINWRRFSLGRFLAFVLASVLWASQITFGVFFGVVFAACLALNGQEWYQGQFGTEGRVGLGWKLWSDGGRSITILGLFSLLAIAITGYASSGSEAALGLEYDDAGLSFDTADALRDLKLKGKVLNLTIAEGDSILWRAPEYKTFIDSRLGAVFTREMREDIEELKKALRDDRKDQWEPILDKYGGTDPGITALMISPQSAQGRLDPAYLALMRSPWWVPLYDGGNAVLFGRMDKNTVDQPIFEAHRLNADEAVFRRGETIPVPERPPSATTWIDYFVRSRNLKQTQPQVYASDRWLSLGATTPGAIDPARCYMAIRAARRALAKNPDDWKAYVSLQTAYRNLMQSESQILSKSVQPNQVPVAYQLFRMRQLLASLNLAVKTAPPPVDSSLKEQLANLNLSLAELFASNRKLDLERDRMQAARDLLPASSFTDEFEQQFGQLNEAIAQIQQQIDTMTAENNLSALQRFEMAVGQGLDGMAIEELRAAESQGANPALVNGVLVDLYCATGQPDEAFPLIETTPPGDPTFGTAPGIAAYRQGTVYFLLGYYDQAISYWGDTAITQLRQAQAFQALNSTQAILLGQPAAGTAGLMEIGGSPAAPGYLSTQAEWEAEIGLCMLEAGKIDDIKDDRGAVRVPGVATRFQNALRLKPDIPIRGLLEYYLQKLGAPLPEATTETNEPGGGGDDGEKPAAPAAAPVDAVKPEEPAAEPKAKA